MAPRKDHNIGESALAILVPDIHAKNIDIALLW